MDPVQIQNVYNAYKSGQMTPEEITQYTEDVRAGSFPLPEGVDSLDSVGEEKGSTPTLPQPIINAYESGQMTPEEVKTLESDIESGVWALPEGMEMVPPWQKELEDLGMWGKIKEQVTGTLRGTEETKNLPQIGYLPELNNFSIEGIKTALGHLTSNPKEFEQILKANFPEVETRKDDKGNIIVKSSLDGKEYAVKPGFTASDIPRTIGTILAFHPASKAKTIAGQVAGAVGTQAAIEAGQSAIGGEFDTEEVTAAGAGAGLMGGVSKLGGKILKKVQDIPKGKTYPQLSTDELMTVTKQAAQGSKKAKEILAAQSTLDESIVESANRLGIADYLQPDQVTTNQAYREVAASIRSIPGSKSKKMELDSISQLGKKADDIVEEFGGTRDLSNLDQTLKQKMQGIHDSLYKKAEKLYSDLAIDIPNKALVKTDNILSFLRTKAKELGGEKYLSPNERKVLRFVTPEEGVEGIPYARLDQLRRDLTAARVRKTGTFKDADTGLIKKLEKELLADQRTVADEYGVLAEFDLAQNTARMYKGMQEDMQSIFGRELNGTIITKLTTGTKKLQSGDISGLNKLLKSVPEGDRQEVMATGLSTAFRKAQSSGQLDMKKFMSWYEGFTENDQARNFVMANLPRGSMGRLKDFYKVVKGIQESSTEKIPIGRLRDINRGIEKADNLMANVYSKVKTAAPGLLSEVGTTMAGLPGVGTAAGVTAALLKKRPKVLVSADELISSPEFIEMAGKGTLDAAKRLSKAPVWKRFYKALGEPNELSNPEQWLLTSWQTYRQTEDEE